MSESLNHLPFLEVLGGTKTINEAMTLSPFSANYGGWGFYLGRYREKDYQFTAKGLPINPGTTVRIEPHFDPERKYFWIDGFKVDGSDPLFTKRILLGEKPPIQAWKGPVIQSTVDWIYGKHDYSKSQEVKHDCAQSHTAVYLDRNLIVYLNNPQLDKSKPVFIVPKEKNPYKWLEIQQEDPNKEERSIFSKVFVDESSDGVTLRKGWQGPEIQAVLDVIEEKKTPGILESFESVVRNGRRVHLLRLGQKDLKFSFSRLISEGDKVTVTPSVNSNGELIFDVIENSSGNHIYRAVFDRSTNSLKGVSSNSFRMMVPPGYWTEESMLAKAREIVAKRGDISVPIAKAEVNGGFVNSILEKYEGGFLKLRSDLGFIQVDKNGLYVDKDGIRWASGQGISQVIGRRMSNIELRLKNVEAPSIKGVSSNGRAISLYPLEEAVAHIRKNLIGPRTKELNRGLISRNEANTALDSLFEEGKSD